MSGATEHGAKHLARLSRRAAVLAARIEAGLVQDLSNERAELESILWMLEEFRRLSTRGAVAAAEMA